MAESGTGLIRRGRPTWRRAAAVAVAGLLIASAALALKPFVTGLSWRFEASRVLVSFSVADAFEDERFKEEILSTRPVTMTFTAEIVKNRSMWKDKLIVRRIVEHTVQYDNLTRQFHVESSLDGEEAERHDLATWDEMADFMSKIRDLPLTSVANLEPSESGYTVRVHVQVRSDFILWIVPWNVETPWVTETLKTP